MWAEPRREAEALPIWEEQPRLGGRLRMKVRTVSTMSALGFGWVFQMCPKMYVMSHWLHCALDRITTCTYSSHGPREVYVSRVIRSLVGGLLAAVLAQSPALLAAPPASAPALGVITQAQRANVGNGAATTGSTIFDGDLLSTDKEGALRVRIGSSQAYLFNSGEAVVHQSADGFSANLTRGGLVLSSGKGQTFHLLADGATIQPGTSQPTVAQVTWVSPKELEVISRKGALQVSMEGETQTVADGASYRMIIDPASVAAGQPNPAADPQNAASTGKNKFLLVLLGAAAAAVTVGVILAVESPSSL